jgi:hypothetical protein
MDGKTTAMPLVTEARFIIDEPAGLNHAHSATSFLADMAAPVAMLFAESSLKS